MSKVRTVAVLYGGMSTEREVSLSSGQQVMGALRDAGYEVRPVLVSDLDSLLAGLSPRPDVVFNALHGRYGEDGCVQGVLEMLGLPYTHSGVRASAVAMDKAAAKAVFKAAGLPVAEHRVLTPLELAAAEPLQRPYVVKPVSEGSSVGVTIFHKGDNDPDGHRADLAASWRYGPTLMAEAFVPGRELTVAVMGCRPLAVTEIVTEATFYDYTAKYAPAGSRHILPADIPATITDEAMRVALAAHRALDCRGVSRADFRYDDTAQNPGRLVLLEVNTQPGMTATSLVPEQASHCGIRFHELCAWMVEQALEAV